MLDNLIKKCYNNNIVKKTNNFKKEKRYCIMANKITKREVIGMMLAEEVVKGNPTYVAYLENELALLDKKAQNKKATKVQTENVGIKATILEVLANIGSGTVSDIQNANVELGALSNQKVSALIRQLVENKEVVKVTDKKKSIFSLATIDEVEG